LYTGPLADLQDIINRAPNPSNMRAAAMTMKADYFAIMTDMWGNIPVQRGHSENFSDRTFTPVYDSQVAVYADLITQLKSAADMFDAGGGQPGCR
jgi:hypothetical protein